MTYLNSYIALAKDALAGVRRCVKNGDREGAMLWADLFTWNMLQATHSSRTCADDDA